MWFLNVIQMFLSLILLKSSEIYLIIWDKDKEYVEQELMKRLNDLKLKFTNCGYRSEILDEKMIIQLVNSYTNPDVAYIEDQEYLQMPPRAE